MGGIENASKLVRGNVTDCPVRIHLSRGINDSGGGGLEQFSVLKMGRAVSDYACAKVEVATLVLAMVCAFYRPATYNFREIVNMFSTIQKRLFKVFGNAFLNS